MVYITQYQILLRMLGEEGWYPRDVVTVDGLVYAVIDNANEFFYAVRLEPDLIRQLPDEECEDRVSARYLVDVPRSAIVKLPGTTRW